MTGTTGTSSARPADLDLFSRTARLGAFDLARAAGELAAAFEAFAVSATDEPHRSAVGASSPVADRLRRLGHELEVDADWVGEVAYGFLCADTSGDPDRMAVVVTSDEAVALSLMTPEERIAAAEALADAAERDLFASDPDTVWAHLHTVGALHVHPEAAAAYIERLGVETLVLVPLQLQAMVTHGHTELDHRAAVEPLSRALGAATRGGLSEAFVDGFAREVSSDGSSAPVLLHGGSFETGFAATMAEAALGWWHSDLVRHHARWRLGPPPGLWDNQRMWGDDANPMAAALHLLERDGRAAERVLGDEATVRTLYDEAFWTSHAGDLLDVEGWGVLLADVVGRVDARTDHDDPPEECLAPTLADAAIAALSDPMAVTPEGSRALAHLLGGVFIDDLHINANDPLARSDATSPRLLLGRSRAIELLAAIGRDADAAEILDSAAAAHRAEVLRRGLRGGFEEGERWPEQLGAYQALVHRAEERILGHEADRSAALARRLEIGADLVQSLILLAPGGSWAARAFDLGRRLWDGDGTSSAQGEGGDDARVAARHAARYEATAIAIDSVLVTPPPDAEFLVDGRLPAFTDLADDQREALRDFVDETPLLRRFYDGFEDGQDEVSRRDDASGAER